MSAEVLHRLRAPGAVDALTAFGFAILVLIELQAHMDDGFQAGAAGWNAPILLGTVIALAWRRRQTELAVAAGYAFVVVPSLFRAHTIFFFGTLIPLVLLTYSAARHLSLRRVAVSLLGPVLLLVAVPIHQPGFDAGDYVFWLMLAALAVGLGVLIRHLDQHRTALAATLAEQVRDQDVREQDLLLDERSRIARELHDVVAHAVSVMVVQAGAARLAVGIDDGEARSGMLAVESAGRDALLELRRLLGLLRPDAEDSAVSPSPRLAMLDDLVSRMRAAGMTVDVRTTGTATQLSAGLDLSVYRIIQEALTNTLKHAGPTTVQLSLHYGDTLEVDIVDDGPVDGALRQRSGPGHGLIGMRERATIFGGSFAAGPHDNGWRVRASIPRPAGQPAQPMATNA